MSIFSKIKLFRSNNNENSKDINNIIDTSDNSSRELTPEEKNMLNNVIGFGESRVEDCMVPRADIVGLELDTDVKDILKIFSESNHSRIPVYKETLDNPIGMLHMKDLISVFSDKNFDDIDIEKFLREILFVPPSMKSRDLLVRMQTSRIHMALVIDEYGGTDGLVTIEDLIEEIIGEIEDELFEEDLDRIKIYDNYIDSSARASIEEINDIVGKSLFTDDIDEEINTIGGLVFVLAGRVPQRGELINHPLGFEIEITDADSRRIKKVRLRIKADRE
ncbi:MAG: CBS domain-containing protein [Pseudomonadota bacterium]|jgi:CBS domain containing-hemolysin-like protein|nr:CBS domain-containing protein [Pseudomonadota bacterium]MEC9097664.1 CBS domain-containing protein [Pseudomonadota bacterium]MED5273002.1 CBS domain-containing protein [Pseudomonadota bacterium]MED5484625.1 CBS domain-containing protein [Pseudomonadota bacterium]|tara:strand:+ start:1467 stop:2297 length:831 start_codon:yes stop_codon:yes gene_type:complete